MAQLKGGEHWKTKPVCGARTLVAKTCKDCGELKVASSFRLTGGAWTNICKKCHAIRYQNGRPWLPHHLTDQQWFSMLEGQGNVCAICKKPPKRWHLDHDHACCPGTHSCGRCVRGALCPGCNWRLRLLDSPDLLVASLNYLGRAALVNG